MSPLCSLSPFPALGQVGALIITPTRELAIQIDEVLAHFTKHFPQFSQILWIGGRNPGEDVAKFKEQGGNIIVATPGRLEDMFRRKAEGLDLASCVRSLDVLVLDEADRLLDMGFEARPRKWRAWCEQGYGTPSGFR